MCDRCPPLQPKEVISDKWHFPNSQRYVTQNHGHLVKDRSHVTLTTYSKIHSTQSKTCHMWPLPHKNMSRDSCYTFKVTCVTCYAVRNMSYQTRHPFHTVVDMSHVTSATQSYMPPVHLSILSKTLWYQTCHPFHIQPMASHNWNWTLLYKAKDIFTNSWAYGMAPQCNFQWFCQSVPTDFNYNLRPELSLIWSLVCLLSITDKENAQWIC